MTGVGGGGGEEEEEEGGIRRRVRQGRHYGSGQGLEWHHVLPPALLHHVVLHRCHLILLLVPGYLHTQLQPHLTIC